MIGKVFKRKRFFLIVTSVTLLSVFFYGFSSKDFQFSKNLDIFFSLVRELSVFYVDEIDPQTLINNSIEGMLNELDPYTSFISEAEGEMFATMTTGRYGGIGSMVRQSGDFVMITEPHENSPATKAGLIPGDLILEIDGESIKGLSVSDVSNKLRGLPKTTLNLRIKRFGNDYPLEKTITREEIRIRNVPFYGMVKETVGYIRLSGFTEDASKEVRDALIDLRDKQGAKSLILDIRGNPGGLLSQAVDISNLFLDRGYEIVSTKGRVKQFDNVYKGRNNPVDTEIPLVVLVNRGSASASEIIAGAIQDHDRGVVIGQRTFGKGLVQAVRPLSFNAQLKVTTARYYTPSGRSIQAIDYTNRNEDGSVGSIPDSLVKQFTTKNGRIVFDGGGITPDIHVEEETLSRISASLYLKNFFFDFATQFVFNNPKAPHPVNFSLSSDEYKQFVEFLEGKDFDYQTRSEESLNELINIAKSERYYEFAKIEFESLRGKLAHDKHKDLQTFREEIIRLLNDEIIGRFFYLSGRVRYSLDKDKKIEIALKILQNKQKYNSILQPGSKILPLEVSIRDRELPDITNEALFARI